ncbi:unnamed protein product [Rotaria socialis]|uniref:Uncharacterized protein n=1 Tax=Rotaria socialis TaxID=392032 RepID=A0A818W0P8_9BILA|nr:unnamed protein product [Rotaria socialis]CAF4434667.1 unnamed protein product [Rotaria socialis]
MMNRYVIEIPLFFNFRFPCATTEYGIIRQSRDTTMKRSLDDERIQSDELANQAMKQLTDKSIYKENIKLIFNNSDLFTHYYHDQVALAHDEAKVYQLPTSFVQRLLTLNPTRSITNQLQHLLIDHVELFEILRIFEISMQLVGEETVINAFNKQSIQNYTSDHLVSSTIISRIDNIEQLINCYNRVIQTEHASNFFENACSLGGFNAAFENCNAIHEFIEYLRNLFVDSESTTDNVLPHRQRTLLELEMEFLKTWLPDNSEQYPEVLALFSKPKNDLWQYSAKILSFIDQEVELFSTVLSKNGQLEDPDKIELLDECLNNINGDTYKIERLLVNRIHMQLMLRASEQGTPEQILTDNYTQFEENVRQLQDEQSNHSSISISLIAWIKYYIELYAVALKNQCSEAIMGTIDQFLTRDELPLSLTLKLFVIKQICELSSVKFDAFCEKFSNSAVVWLRTILEKPQDQQSNQAQHNLILPTPLFVGEDEFKRISDILSYSNDIEHLRQLITNCTTNQTSSYCFLVWFIHYYLRFYTKNATSIDEKWVRLFTHELNQHICKCFDVISSKLLISLCKNFSNTSYFRLQPNMDIKEVHQRLVVLNIAVYLLSCKSLNYITYVGSLLFDDKRQMPNNYTERLQSSICLPGLLSSDIAITKMLYVRTQVKERLDRSEIVPDAMFIYKCSDACPYMFHFEGCGRPYELIKCPMCKTDIGATSYNKPIIRIPPHTQMPIEAGFQFIADYIKT